MVSAPRAPMKKCLLVTGLKLRITIPAGGTNYKRDERAITVCYYSMRSLKEEPDY